MKKLIFVFVLFLGMLFIPEVSASLEGGPINVHIFKSSTCPHCAEAMEFFEELSNDSEYSNYFHLIAYETYGNTEEIRNNVKLAEKVEQHFGGEFEGVPLIVIGDKKYDGYASTLNEQLKERIKTCYEEQCEDIVLGIQNDTLKSNPLELIIPIIIAIVVIGGVGYLIILCCKPIPTNDEAEILEKKEKIVEEKTEKSTRTNSSKSSKQIGKTTKKKAEAKK